MRFNRSSKAKYLHPSLKTPLPRRFYSRGRRLLSSGLAAAIIVVSVVALSAQALAPARSGHSALYGLLHPLSVPLTTLVSMAPLTNSKSTPTGLAGSSSSNSSSGDWTHTHITTTFFWVGEPADSENDYITNVASAWDDQWQQHFGGADTPQSRNGWWPAAFKPKENPFYIALPYNDFDAKGKRKASAQKCLPTAVQTDANRSWCKNSWVMIRHNGQVVYAQWEDAGPLGEDDVDYVFGNSAFRNTWGAKAGLDVSPAVHDYLHLQDVDTTDWSLVPASKVPDGPWKQIVTQ